MDDPKLIPLASANEDAVVPVGAVLTLKPLEFIKSLVDFGVLPVLLLPFFVLLARLIGAELRMPCKLGVPI